MRHASADSSAPLVHHTIPERRQVGSSYPTIRSGSGRTCAPSASNTATIEVSSVMRAGRALVIKPAATILTR